VKKRGERRSCLGLISPSLFGPGGPGGPLCASLSREERKRRRGEESSLGLVMPLKGRRGREEQSWPRCPVKRKRKRREEYTRPRYDRSVPREVYHGRCTFLFSLRRFPSCILASSRPQASWFKDLEDVHPIFPFPLPGETRGFRLLLPPPGVTDTPRGREEERASPRLPERREPRLFSGTTLYTSVYSAAGTGCSMGVPGEV